MHSAETRQDSKKNTTIRYSIHMDLRVSTMMADVTGSCFPSIEFSIKISKLSQQEDQLDSELQLCIGLKDLVSISIPMNLCLFNL